MEEENYKPFEDIWILNSEGKIIFEHRSEKEAESFFIKMLFDGLTDFTIKYFKDKITSLKLGDMLYTFLSMDELVFIGSTKCNNKNKKLRRKLSKVVESLQESL